jgi:hypothetical protein
VSFWDMLTIALPILVIKSEVSYVHVDTFLESHDVTFFENIFPIKNSYDISSLPTNMIADTTFEPSKFFDLYKHTPKPIQRLIVKLLGGARNQGVQSLSMMISLFISWMTPLKSLSRHLHLLMLMIEKKRSIVR